MKIETWLSLILKKDKEKEIMEVYKKKTKRYK